MKSINSQINGKDGMTPKLTTSMDESYIISHKQI